MHDEHGQNLRVHGMIRPSSIPTRNNSGPSAFAEGPFGKRIMAQQPEPKEPRFWFSAPAGASCNGMTGGGTDRPAVKVAWLPTQEFGALAESATTNAEP